jgi:excisionase family DNA binding protein
MEKYLTPKQVAPLLGWVNYNSIYTLKSRGTLAIPFSKVGGRLLISQTRLDEWIASQCINQATGR